jgi:hypothetical protein
MYIYAYLYIHIHVCMYFMYVTHTLSITNTGSYKSRHNYHLNSNTVLEQHTMRYVFARPHIRSTPVIVSLGSSHYTFYCSPI